MNRHNVSVESRHVRSENIYRYIGEHLLPTIFRVKIMGSDSVGGLNEAFLGYDIARSGSLLRLFFHNWFFLSSDKIKKENSYISQ